MARRSLDRAASSVALLSLAVWLGGLVALGAITAPIVFAVAPYPQSADAMTLVFRRFDHVAMGCAALVLGSEAIKAALRHGPRGMARVDAARAVVSALGAATAVFEGMVVSPRIAALHGAGALRGVGALGIELSRLHDTAETCGKTQVVLLAAALVMHGLRGPNGPDDGPDAAPTSVPRPDRRVDGRSSEP